MTSINGKSILIIDDDAAMLRALGKVLGAEGATVTSARWAGEAMEYLTGGRQSFHLIITDLRMPVLGGRTILGAVTVALPHVPVIIITAFSNPELKADCLHLGAAAFLEKPLDTAQLIEAIEHVFSASGPASTRRAQRRRGARPTGAAASGSSRNLLVRVGGEPHGSDT